MKVTKILSALFLGRNTGNLASRFEFHLWALIALFLMSAVGTGFQKIGQLQKAHGDAPPAWLTGASAIADITMPTAIILLGYVTLLSLALCVVGLLVKGEPEDQAS
jgi:hypothetical protein